MTTRPFSTTLLLRTATIVAVSGVALLMSACAPTVTHHGYLAFDNRPTDIKVGDTKATVIDKLGEPSQTAAYDPTEWYYVDQISMSMTYKMPHVTSRSVTIIDFDKATDTVEAIQTLSLADGRLINPNPNQTPTRGRSLSILEQLLGTVGHQSLTGSSQDNNPGNQHRKD